MYKTFNMGIGMILIMRAEAADALLVNLDLGEDVFVIGEVVEDETKGVHYSSGN